MRKQIITISREFGSGGRFIGEEIARKLGVKCYDHDLIIELAKQTGFDEKYLENASELSPKAGLFAYSFLGRDLSGRSVEDMIYEAQRQIILELADREPCVIIGRNADHILKDRNDVLNVFIHGNKPEKIKRICEQYQLSEHEAERKLIEVDKKRGTNYRFYTDKEWGKSQNYTLSLNSSILGYEKCEEIIIGCM